MILRYSADTAEQFLYELRMADELSFDTETTGLEEHDRLFCATFSTDENQYYIERGDLPVLREIFEDPTKLWFMQNAKFDMRMALNEGFRFAGRVWDITVMARLVRNDHVKYNLESQAKRAGMAKLDGVEREVGIKKLYEMRPKRVGPPEKSPRYDWVDREKLIVYAAVDAELTFKLAKIYLKEFTPEHIGVMNNEADLTKVCFAMERRGICVNIPYVISAMKQAEALARNLRKNFFDMTGIEFVDSGKVLMGIFQSRNQPITMTDKGNPSFTSEVLLKYDDPLARVILDIRSADKEISTYYTNFLNMYVEDKSLPKELGVIHPTMWQAGTRTGRFSYSEPNLQNLTKDSKDTPDEFVIRGCFVPRPGKVFLSLDYQAVEYRMMLAYANQRDLIEAVMGGADVHQATAGLVGTSRQEAKTLNFAILYGAGAEKLARMLQVTKVLAQRFKDKYFMKLPKVETFIDTVISTGRARGYVKNWFGRRLYAEREFCYALPNHLIQGGSADVIKVAMVQIGPDEPLLVQIHDELLFEVDESEVLEKARKYATIMEAAFPEKNGMRLKVDAKWSKKSMAERDMEPLAL